MGDTSGQIPIGASTGEAVEILRDVRGQIDQERAYQKLLEGQIEEAMLAKRQAEASAREERELDPSLSQKHQRKPSFKSHKKKVKKVNKELLALQTEVDGMQQLTQELCEELPAVKAARERETRRTVAHPSSQYHQSMLSSEAIRILEIQPWHPTAVKHSQATDSVFEWQYWNSEEENWEGALASFPDNMLFHTLPILSTDDDSDWKEEEENSSSSNPPSEQNRDEKNETSAQDTSQTSPIDPASITATPAIHPETAPAVFDLQHLLAGLLPPSAAVRSTIHAARKHHHSQSRPKHNIRNKYGPVLTNAAVTHRLSLDTSTGFTLPDPSESGGTWKWLGWWKIGHSNRSLAPLNEDTEKSDCSQTSTRSAPLDSEGWIYAREESHHDDWNASKLSWGTFEDHCPAPVLRRRKWIRQRVLVDYPLASEATLEYLQLKADNASMVLATKELQNKLYETTDQNEQVQQYATTTNELHQEELARYQLVWELQEERIKALRYGRFQRKIEELACSPDDILPILSNPELFGHLQDSLRNSGAITNAMLQQGIHFYIQDYIRQRELQASFNNNEEGLNQNGDGQLNSDDETEDDSELS